jgi:hypothetical protein
MISVHFISHTSSRVLSFITLLLPVFAPGLSSPNHPSAEAWKTNVVFPAVHAPLNASHATDRAKRNTQPPNYIACGKYCETCGLFATKHRTPHNALPAAYIERARHTRSRVFPLCDGAKLGAYI